MYRLILIALLLFTLPGLGQAEWKLMPDEKYYWLGPRFIDADDNYPTESFMVVFTLPPEAVNITHFDMLEWNFRPELRERLYRAGYVKDEASPAIPIMRDYIKRLEARIDSLEAMIRRMEIVEVVDSIATPGCGYWWSSSGWYRNEWDSIPAQIAGRDTCWEYTTRYKISFELGK